MYYSWFFYSVDSGVIEMKSAKEYLIERVDDLALEYHGKFYCDLTKELQQTIWAMAERDYADYYGMMIDSVYDRLKEGKLNEGD